MSNVTIAAKADFPTAFGNFTILSFDSSTAPLDDFAVIKGDLAQKENVLVRVQSECVTSDVFSSMRCDCGEQLETSLKMIEKEGVGCLIYLRQEGRGIGIRNKIKAYQLEDQGFDTVESMEKMGFPVDQRDYQTGITILKLFEVKSIRLISNNPDKIKKIQDGKVVISEVIHTKPTVTEYNRKYLLTKKTKMGHLFDLE